MTDPTFQKFPTLAEKVAAIPMQLTGEVHVVEMTESERGWGQRPDGFMVFPTKEDCTAYIQKQTADRNGPVPDYYVRYDYIGLKRAGANLITRLEKKGVAYIDRLSELMSYDFSKYKQ